MFSEGVIPSQRLCFCQSFINDETNLNLLRLVALFVIVILHNKWRIFHLEITK